MFSTDEILARIWPGSRRANATDVKQYVHLLRNKVEPNPRLPERIQNVKGFGYTLVV